MDQPTRSINLRAVTAAMVSLALMFGLSSHALASDSNDAWNDLYEELYEGRSINEDVAGVVLHAPNQAADAALVPIMVRLSSQVVNNIKALTIIVDRNPVPVAAQFAFSKTYRDGGEIGERVIATRIRVDSFSHVRVVAEMIDGSLSMSKQFVFGAGGCSSPSTKDADSALANLGQIRIRERDDANHAKQWREVRVMIRHPNYTGMQMDAKKGSFTPARFIENLSVRNNGNILFQVEGGISLSENPLIRFTYGSNGKSGITVQAVDSDGAVFRGDGKSGSGT